MSILYWNCRGYTSNFEDLKILLLNHNPNIVCLQETFHGNNQPYPPRQYSIISADPVVNYAQGTRPSRGVLTLIHRSIPYQEIALRTPLEATAIRIHSTNATTVCNIYITPNENLQQQDLLNLIRQLPPPFVLVGDLNAHSPMWGSTLTNGHGQIVENILMTTDTCLLNTGESTRVHVQTGTSSCIDLCLVSSLLLTTYEWVREDDTHGSDHYPILVREANSLPTNVPQRFLINRADWQQFEQLTDGDFDPLMNLPIDEMTSSFTSLLVEAADLSIPKSSGRIRPHPVPWWNQACQASHQERKTALRRYMRTRSPFDKVELNRATAFARFIKRRARRSYWEDFVSSITKDTPMSKIWKRVKKLNGKYPTNHPPSVMVNGSLHQDPQIVCNLLGEHVAAVSSDTAYPPAFIPIKERAESSELNFQTDAYLSYNSPITIREIKCSLQQTKKKKHSSRP